jgi:predicted MFS family arabinose efflux permease
VPISQGQAHIGTPLGWRSAFVIAGILGAAGVLIAWAGLPVGDYAAEEDPQPLLDFRTNEAVVDRPAHLSSFFFSLL